MTIKKLAKRAIKVLKGERENLGNIDKVLNLPVENKGNYLVPLRDIVTVEEVIAPNSIARRDLKRSSGR